MVDATRGPTGVSGPQSPSEKAVMQTYTTELPHERSPRTTLSKSLPMLGAPSDISENVRARIIMEVFRGRT